MSQEGGNENRSLTNHSPSTLAPRTIHLAGDTEFEDSFELRRIGVKVRKEPASFALAIRGEPDEIFVDHCVPKGLVLWDYSLEAGAVIIIKWSVKRQHLRRTRREFDGRYGGVPRMGWGG